MSEPKEFSVEPNSSVDLIDRAARFYRVAMGVHNVLDFSKYEGEELKALRDKTFDLQHAAMIIMHSESGPE